MRLVVASSAFAALIFGYWLLDRAVKSDGEQMVRKVAEVADGVTRHDLDAAFTHVSDRFERRGKNTKAFRRPATTSFVKSSASRW